ncbi:MAG: ATP-dependent DNA ligase, partial [Nocardioides sp.]|uniref:ATP-dependent DNA ligase n=1 Tax=Nocardioides sp. TaxID=35761 RepID=UPI003F033436
MTDAEREDRTVLLSEIVATSQQVAATRSRKAKVSALADALRRSGPDELVTVVAYLAGSLRQRRTGVGWRGLGDLPEPAAEPSLTPSEVHDRFEVIASLAGPGSQARRRAEVEALFAAATEAEQQWLRAVVTGNVRQGALESLVVDAVAACAEVPLAAVRRAAMLTGDPTAAAVAAFEGGVDALAAIGLEVGRPVSPMLASSAPDVASAVAAFDGSVAVEAKLDGIRLQVHRDGDEVVAVTRSLDDITARLPEVVEIVRALPGDRFVLDGEALWLTDDGVPRPFQETASRAASRTGGAVTPYFFDLLHLDGADLLDEPAQRRFEALAALVPEQFRVRRTVTDDPVVAEEFARSVLAAGHEGVVVKDLSAPYAAGRRGAAWVKVKPVHTVDLVVLAVEHGSGRRTGTLSNIHLGARGADGSLIPVGKTFKGMTDQMLAWQTQRFRELEVSDDGWVVTVRPEQVVEI